MTKGRFFFFSFLLVLSVVLAFVYYKNFYYQGIAAQDLAHAYTQDAAEADKEFLNKRVKVLGQVKAFYTMLGTRKVLELKTYEGDLPVICLFLKNEDQFAASQLKEDQYVNIKGKCVGTSAYSFVRGVKIEVESVKPAQE